MAGTTSRLMVSYALAGSRIDVIAVGEGSMKISIEIFRVQAVRLKAASTKEEFIHDFILQGYHA